MVFGNMLSAVDKWWQVIMGVLGEALNLIGYLFYAVFTGVGMLIDFVMSLFRRFAGIESMELKATIGGKTQKITVGGDGNWTDITYAFITSEAVQTAFWTILAMCIALLVVFTIFAIVKSEFATDAKGAAKGPIIQRAVKSVLNFFLIPVISFVSIYGANMLTKAVAATFNAGSNYNITNLVFNAGALNANRVSLDNGFANYLLTTDTVYFANEPKETPQSTMTSMLKKYFTTEGSIRVQRAVYKRVSEEGMGSDFERESLDEKIFSLKQNETIIDDNGSYWFYDPIEAETYVNNVINLKDISFFEAVKSNQCAGLFSYQMKTETRSKRRNKLKVGDSIIEYSYHIQLPVSVFFSNEKNGFKQIIPNCEITYETKLGTEGSKWTDKFVCLKVLDPDIGLQPVYIGAINEKFGKGETIKRDDIDTWQGTEGEFQFCGATTDSVKDEIFLIVNNYLNSVNANSAANTQGSVTLWEVLKEFYYDADASKRIFTGDRPEASQDSIMGISNEQRNKLAEFINKIFVGDGGWSDGFCKYYYYEKNDGEKLVPLTEEQIENQNEEEKSKYLEISSATLHVGSGGKKIWENAIHDDWSIEYTPDYQQTYWKPTSYTRDAVMDTGLVGYFYKFNNMNLILMTFGMVAVAWQYFKLILVFVKRALEMALLFLMAPVVTAIAPLDGGNAEKSWRGSWTKQLIMTCIPVFAINIFFIILPLVTSLNPWADSTGSIVNPIYITYQAFLSIIFIYVGVGMINKASSMLAGYLGTEDMLATGKDLTNKAVGTVGTAAKGAAIVAGGAFSGLATAIKGGKSWLNGRIEGHKSMNESIAAAKADLQSQIDAEEAKGDQKDTERIDELKERLSTVDHDMRHERKSRLKDLSSFYAGYKEKDSNMVSKITGLNEADNQVIADKQADIDSKHADRVTKMTELAELEKETGYSAGSNSKYKRARPRDIRKIKRIKELKNEIASLSHEISLDQAAIDSSKNAIAGRQADLDKYSKSAKYNAENERYYSQMLSAREDKKNAIKTGKKEEWAKLQKDGFYGEFADWQNDKFKKSGFGQFLSKPNVLSSSLNWAINKAIFGAAGVGLQVADRHLSSIPRTGIDFVKSVDASAGAIV